MDAVTTYSEKETSATTTVGKIVIQTKNGKEKQHIQAQDNFYQLCLSLSFEDEPTF